MGEDGLEIEGDGFYLPPEFFTDDDFITEKETFKRHNSLSFPSHHAGRQSFESPTYLSPSVFQTSNIQGLGMGIGELCQTAWAIQNNPTRIGMGMYGGGAAVKRKCAGTGVFLPRRYGDDVYRNARSSNSRKKTQDTTVAIRAHTKKFDSSISFTPSHPVSQSRLNNALIQEYEMLVARRHAMMLQHRRNLLLLDQSPMISRDMYLPSRRSGLSDRAPFPI